LNLPGEVKKRTVWVWFYLSVGTLLLLCLAWLYWYQVQGSYKTIDNSLLEHGRSHFKSIVLTRRWVTEHGGVYVFKRPGVESNPYLPGTDIETKDNRILVLRNPALITREISEYAKKDADFSFHITSDKPLNPNNRPDEWEKKAIGLFQAGSEEYYSKVQSNGETYYRYIAPLYVEASCLACHSQQGYKVGEISGGISVRFNISGIEKALAESLWRDTAIFVFISLLLFLSFFSVIWFFQKNILRSEKKITELANTDSLTGLYSRGFLMDIFEHKFEQSQRYNHPLSFIMIDLDHFKQVNDQYGHQVGDEALRKVANVLTANIRKSDLAARYGGEELAIVLIETEFNVACELAEKLREIISNIEIGVGNNTLNITASLGVSSINSDASEDDIENVDQLIKVADDALYRAKHEGRNRVCCSCVT